MSGVSAAALVQDLMASSLGVHERVPPDVWVERHMRLPAKGRARPGPVRLDITPYLRRPLRSLAFDTCRQITLMCGTQLGKTMLLDSWKCWAVDQDPGAMIVYYPDDDTAQRHNTKMFLPMLAETPVMRQYMLELRPRDTKLTSIDFATMTMYFYGMASKAKRRSIAADKLCLDEVSAYQSDDVLDEVFDRVKSYERSKVVLASSPTDEHVNIHKHFEMGTRESWWVPCPHCDRYQTLRLGTRGQRGSLTWDISGATVQEQIEHAKATARYVCVHCGEDIFEHHKPEMQRRGVWVPRGMDVDEVRENYARAADRAGVNAHDYRVYPSLAPEWNIRAHHSFQLGSLHSQLGGASFGDNAEAVMKAGGVTRRVVNGWLGEPWVEMGDRLEVAELERLCVPAAAGGYRLASRWGGRVPAGVLAITAGTDVQKDRVYVTVYGWGAQGVDCWLIDRAVIPRQMGQRLVELDAWLGAGPAGSGPAGGGGRTYVTEAGERLGIWGMAIDSGAFTPEVYEAVRRLRARKVRVWSSKGTGERGGGWARYPVQLVTIDKWPDGTPMPGGVEHLNMNVDYLKTEVFSRIRGVTEDESELERAAEDARQRGIEDPLFAAALEQRRQRPAGTCPALYLPENTDRMLDEYLIGITAEHRAEDRGTAKRPRSLTYRWQPRPGREDRNHDLDATVGAFAVAMVGNVRLLGVEVPVAAGESGQAEQVPG